MEEDHLDLRQTCVVLASRERRLMVHQVTLSPLPGLAAPHTKYSQQHHHGDHWGCQQKHVSLLPSKREVQSPRKLISKLVSVLLDYKSWDFRWSNLTFREAYQERLLWQAEEWDSPLLENCLWCHSEYYSPQTPPPFQREEPWSPLIAFGFDWNELKIDKSLSLYILPLQLRVPLRDLDLVFSVWREIVHLKDALIFHFNSRSPSFDWGDLNKKFLFLDIGIGTVHTYDLEERLQCGDSLYVGCTMEYHFIISRICIWANSRNCISFLLTQIPLAGRTKTAISPPWMRPWRRSVRSRAEAGGCQGQGAGGCRHKELHSPGWTCPGRTTSRRRCPISGCRSPCCPSPCPPAARWRWGCRSTFRMFSL